MLIYPSYPVAISLTCLPFQDLSRLATMFVQYINANLTQ